MRMTMVWKFLSGFLTLCFVWSLVLLYLRYMEKRTLYYPTKEIEFLPKEIGLDFEEVFFNTSDNLKLNGWFIPSRGAKYTILFCHGNAGNISHRLEKIKFFNQLGCNVFIFDYRGYGKSQGSPSENGLYSDAESAYKYLLSRRINASQIICYGESLGGAVAIDLAAKKELAALIVDSAFSNAKDMASHVYPFLPYWIFSSRFDSLSKIKSLKIPKLIIHSLNDEVVPYKLGRRLYDISQPPKEFLQVHGGHNICFYESEGLFKEKITAFIDRLGV